VGTRNAIARCLRRLCVAVTGDLRACFGQRDSNRGAKTSRSAGNQRHAIAQFELLENQYVL
jgi:hypothetical protein